MAAQGSVNNVETVRHPLARAAVDRLFAATPEELGQAAVRGARDCS